MKCIVLGGRGFIGSHLIQALRNSKHKVLSFDLKDGQDIRNKSQVANGLRWADVVYHLAALTDVQESIKQPWKYYETNILGTLIVSSLCKNKKLIYTSTAAIYDPTSSPYAYSKYIAEDFVKHLPKSFTILRLFNVYGKGMKRQTMIARFLRENPLTIYGDGKQTRDFIHRDDVVKILVDALKQKWNGFCGDVGTGHSLTVNKIASWYGTPVTHVASREEVRYSRANTQILKKLYPEPLTNLKDYIDKQVKR